MSNGNGEYAKGQRYLCIQIHFVKQALSNIAQEIQNNKVWLHWETHC